MLEYCQLGTWEPTPVKFQSKLKHFHSRKMHLRMSPAKPRPFCHGLNVLTIDTSSIFISRTHGKLCRRVYYFHEPIKQYHRRKFISTSTLSCFVLFRPIHPCSRDHNIGKKRDSFPSCNLHMRFLHSSP